VTITHPQHPLYGQRVEIVRARRGADPDLIIRLSDGYHGAIAASLTDYAGAPVSDLVAGAPVLLDPRGLLEIARLVAQQRQSGRIPESDSI